MNRTMVSVIVPVYNTEQYIDSCISSITNQTYDDFELLIVNDGSTDSSLEKCKKLEKEDARIKVLSKSNGGLSSARNYGLQYAKGEYVCFIDSDDYVEKDFLLKLINLINEDDYDIAQCCFSEVYNKTSKKEQSFQIVKETAKNEEILKEYFNPNKLQNRIYHNVCNKLFRRSLFENIEFIEGIYYEDLAIMYSLLRKSKSIILTNEKLYYYNRNNLDSITKNVDYKHLNDAYSIIISINENMKNIHYIKEDLQVFVTNQLINIYESSFDVENEKRIIILRKKLRKELIKVNSRNKLLDRLKTDIRIMLPHLHRKYRILLGQRNG